MNKVLKRSAHVNVISCLIVRLVLRSYEALGFNPNKLNLIVRYNTLEH